MEIFFIEMHFIASSIFVSFSLDFFLNGQPEQKESKATEIHKNKYHNNLMNHLMALFCAMMMVTSSSRQLLGCVCHSLQFVQYCITWDQDPYKNTHILIKPKYMY